MPKIRLPFTEIYPAGGIYSRGVRSDNMLFISGTTALRSSAQGDTPMNQLRVILDRIVRMVAAQGGNPSDIVKLTTYVTNKSDWWPLDKEHIAIYKEYFNDEFPTNSLIEVKGLVEEGLDIEIDAIAILN